MYRSRGHAARRTHRLATATLAAALAFPAVAADDAAVTVTASRVAYRDHEATHDAEVHSRRMIEQSGARDLVDYLASHSSLTVMPNYGNRYTPTLEMRGYGLEAGNQNVVVTVDGQRLNTIDLQPQLLGAIPLADIERIEIVKGTGSVMQGDGAMAGAIRLFTRPRSGASVEAAAGTHGAARVSAGGGLRTDRFDLSLSAENDRQGGLANADSSGKKDASSLRTERVNLKVRPTEAASILVEANQAHVDTRYQNALTLAQYSANPAQNGGATIYTNYVSDVARLRLGGEYAFSDALRLTADYHRLDQRNVSRASWGSFTAGYDTKGIDAALVYRGGDIDLTAGMQRSDASRTQTTNTTTKDNAGLFVQGRLRLGATALSLGGRRETVDYRYRSTAGATTRGEHALAAWDVGANHNIDERHSVFANFNSAFQAPDIDRFFNTGGVFNGLIAPARARTLTLGLHRRQSADNRFKLTLFAARLQNEIYYDPISFNNTNIDRSRKHGLELHQYWKPSPALAINAGYTWTRATIDQEDRGAGAYNGKEMPGVPRHGVNLSATWAVSDATRLTATHAWRSRSYAIGDFDNNNAQRQAAFETTGLNLNHRRGGIDYFLVVGNLFARKNAMWTGDNSIYPVNYARTAAVGMKAEF